MQPRSRRLPGSDGLSIHVLEWSDEGTPLVLVHGFGNEAHIWDDFAPVVAPHYRTVAVELRGHGDSDRPEAGYALADFAGDVLELLDALKVEAATIAGHSLGASIALRFALDHAERTRGIALLGCFAGYRHNPAVTELAAAVSQLTDPVDTAFIRDFQAATLARPLAPERFEQIGRLKMELEWLKKKVGPFA